MSDFHKRGFHNIPAGENLYVALKDNGVLSPIVDMVISNVDLTLEIRDNYINIYYKGGSVAKITSPRSVDLNKNYFRCYKDKSEENWNAIDNEVKKAKLLFKAGKFQEYIEFVKKAMLNYWKIVLEEKSVEEKKTQHQICLSNAYGHSDYTQLDVEYEVSTKSVFRYSGLRRTNKGGIPTPRFDIIAIRNSDHRLCIIELKKGTDALAGESGVQEHAESYHNTVGLNDDTQKAFLEEMQGVVTIKQSLHLLPKDVFIDQSLAPQYIFAYQYSSSDKNTCESEKNTFLHYQNDTLYKLNKLNKVNHANHAKGMKVLWLEEKDFALKDHC